MCVCVGNEFIVDKLKNAQELYVVYFLLLNKN